MTMSCHSLFSKDMIAGLNRWRSSLTVAAGLQAPGNAGDDEAIDEATLAANRRSAIEAARNLGAAVA
jgi:hypothetical protein